MKVRFAQVEPTTRCNYTCGFCAGRHMPQQDLSLETFARFLEAVDGLEALELQGEGEPLMHPEFFRLVAMAKARFPELEVSMISNGSLFTSDNINALLDHGIAKIFVSVESVKDDDFQRIRGGKLDRVRRGIRALLAERDRRGLQRPLVGLAVTVLRSTASELASGIPAFYRELKLDGGITAQPLVSSPQYERFYDDAMRAELADITTAELFEAANQPDGELHPLMMERRRHGQIGFYERLYGSVDVRLQCPWLINGVYLTTQGLCMPCCYAKDYDKHRIGSTADGLAGVAEMRKQLQTILNRGQMPTLCKGCPTAYKVARNSQRVRTHMARTGGVRNG